MGEAHGTALSKEILFKYHSIPYFLSVVRDLKITWILGFPGGTEVKNPPANAGDMGSIPGPGRSHMPRSN